VAENRSDNGSDNEQTWAVVVFSDGGAWQVGQLPPGVSADLGDVERAV
jgi:hypothetical protein